ncbi:2-polyprenyl-6-methoxyphenol hydroxylase-like FAD-dependent oxidoreductase [Herbihabitans rhizosphaerae]|uniref:2-polyprenyl-6-methoxyphenol hydroxylase-like FAD-dependent oxidoreductase n=1 Tax=Herbihabitans rhizosphaerae TaxID=1872711 RepID=A0A4Q7KGW8_9PSEU|nr:FAD-dependent monooxygenase [Herbihabitans rhizosphaerae]RZS31442.1 2-polyprenyl-6-methoxyphenol hydroxylase-like FAD-dependent oxidoreductase [Herbihabitans rhizosphaerae]
MKALIIGGGIAGPVTAIALKRAGIDATVYEAYDSTADGVGAFLSLATNGLDALRTLDLFDVVRDKGFATPRMVIRLSSGKELAQFEHGGMLDDGTVSHTIKRSDLYGALRDEAVRRGVEIVYGKRLTDAEAAADGVTARFADGSTATGDLLIGADGLRSVTRTLIDPAAPKARYTGLLNTGGYAHGVPVDAEPGVLRMIFGKRCFLLYVAHPNGEVWWGANPPRAGEPSREDLAAITPERWRAELIDLFADYPLGVRLIKATEKISPPWPTQDFPTVPTWHRDRMIIIGDAAHATSPASGQGASMAMEDAVTLAKCLRDADTIEAAFADYERLRRERVERVVAQGKRNGDQKALGFVGRLLLPLVFKLNRTKQDTGWMYDHHIPWDSVSPRPAPR